VTEWKLVPTTPTWEMQVRARDAMIDATGNEDLSTDEVAVGLVAAVSASPAPPDVVGVLESIVENEHQFSMGWAAERARALLAQLKGEAK
jgi:hypothetical protein